MADEKPTVVVDKKTYDHDTALLIDALRTLKVTNAELKIAESKQNKCEEKHWLNEIPGAAWVVLGILAVGFGVGSGVVGFKLASR